MWVPDPFGMQSGMRQADSFPCNDMMGVSKLNLDVQVSTLLVGIC